MLYQPPADAQPISHLEHIVDPAHAMRVKEEAFYYMDSLEGWCTKQKASILIDIVLKAQPMTIVEIGVWGGKSLVPMATAVRANEQGIVYGIDPWDRLASVEDMIEENNILFWSKVDHQRVREDLIINLERFDLDYFTRIFKTSSEDAPPIHDIDVLHIDGNHSDHMSYLDVTKWVPLVRRGGWIIFDGMGWAEKGTFTTARAVNWLSNHCNKIAEYQEDGGWGIWLKR